MTTTIFKNLLGVLLIILVMITVKNYTAAADNTLAERLRGKLLLQVEDRGQIWYVDENKKRRQLTADNAYGAFEELALGISDADLEAIPTAENFLAETQDSDGDGYSDKTEAQFGYNLFGAGKAVFDNNLAKRLSGRLLLQVNDKGRIWYVNPDNLKKYEVRRTNIMSLFRALALGITNDDLNKIEKYNVSASTSQPTTPDNPPTSQPIDSGGADIVSYAASAIINGSITQAQSYFTPEMQTAIAYTINFLNSEGRYNLGNIMSGAQLTSSNSSEKIYSTTVSHAGYTKTLNFRVQKQPDGSWLLANL
ncbi:MAG: hypothetical protein Q8Q23_04995 [bacterium]|nr:hypothetical protein [bacterium]